MIKHEIFTSLLELNRFIKRLEENYEHYEFININVLLNSGNMESKFEFHLLYKI
jgi:hypothetical protein